MKRSLLNTAFVLMTVGTAMCTTAFGDGKGRLGSGGFSRGHGSGSGGQVSSLIKGRVGNLNIGNGSSTSGSGGARNNHPGGIHGSGGSSRQLHGFVLPGNGNNGSNHQSNSVPQIPVSSHQGGIGNTSTKVAMPHNVQKLIAQSRHTIQLPDGTRAKPIAINLNQILKHKVQSLQVQPRIQHIVASAPKHLCAQPHFTWWVNVCQHHCHANYGTWNIHNRYWDGWTPCNWQIVSCDHFTYYVGLSCVYIPDMQAYGVQSVNAGSPAEIAGLQAGDLILMVNQQSVFDSNLINIELNRGRLDMQVVRDGAPAQILLTVLPRLVQTSSF